MAVELVMPRLSDSMEEGTIVSWLVADGQSVVRGEEIAEIETDKATVPYEAPEHGVLRILVPAGTTLRLGEPIALIDDLAPLPADHSVAPPGSDAEGNGSVPAPRAPGEDPATSSFSIDPEQHGQHTVHASFPPPGPGVPPRGASRSAAWGALDDESETTEFDAIQWPPQPSVPLEPPRAAEPYGGVTDPQPMPWVDTSYRQPAPGTAPHEAAHHDEDDLDLADDLFDDDAHHDEDDEAGTPVAPIAEPAADAHVEPVAEPTADTPAEPVEEPAADPPAVSDDEPATDEHAVAAPASPTAAADPAGDDEHRYSAQDLIAPQALPPRPPQLRAAPAGGDERVSASPVARRLAQELGVDLSTLAGTGPEGRIVRADIEAAVASGAARPPQAPSAAVPSERAPRAREEAEPEPESPAEPQVVPEPDPLPEPEVVPEPEPQPEVTPEPPQPEITPEPAQPEIVPEPDPQPTPEPQPIPADPPIPVVSLAAPGAAEAQAAAAAEKRVLPAAQAGGGKGTPDAIELTRQQQTVARRMAESKATIPDFQLTLTVDAAPLMDLREELAATRPDLRPPTVNDLVVKATALALRAFPRLNGAYRDGRVEQYPKVNVGIAVDAGDNLLVPVVHDADALTVGQIAERTADVVARARDGALRPPDIASATFTLTNLGGLGIERFTAVITPGQSGMLTVGAVTARPVVRDGQLVAGRTLELTLIADHRAVYGAEAARFLTRVRDLLQRPAALLA